MNLDQRLDASIVRWNLLESRFYRAWNEGRLPRESLAKYASEYGAFISLIPQGWASHGDEKTAAEERLHVELWRNFARHLGVDISSETAPTVRGLVTTAEVLFSEATTSLGALYAFEAQQPHTAASKLSGLEKHYNLTGKACEYFVVHAQDEHEPALLRRRIRALPAGEQTRATRACEEMCQSLRRALDGMMPAESTA